MYQVSNMAPSSEPHGIGIMSPSPRPTSQSRGGVEDGPAQRLPEDTSSSSRKVSGKVTVTEQMHDHRTVPKPDLPGSSSTIISNAKLRISMPPSLSTNRGRSVRQEEPRQSAFLSVLPHDVHYLIATRYVDFDALLALRQTCRTLYSILTPELVRLVRSNFVRDSLAYETVQYREHRSRYPRFRLAPALWELLYANFDLRLMERPAKYLRCYGCLEVKPLWCFVERMSNRGTGLGAKSAKDRMCKACMRRYRDIEGQWWRENWIKKRDVVVRTSRSRRLRQWVLLGESLVNPEEDVGVCSSCGSSAFELWWGCVSCFELEERRRREEDALVFDGVIQRKIVDFLEAWLVRKEAKRRKRQSSSRDRRARRSWLPGLSVNVGGSVADRRAALMEWKDNKASQKRSGTGASKPGGTQASTWKALDQIPLPKSRMEARCPSCWVPNCPHRAGMPRPVYARPLPRERWCPACQAEYNQRHGRRETRISSGMKPTVNPTTTDIFSDEWIDDGLARLFDDI